jgi:hypothetical protein
MKTTLSLFLFCLVLAPAAQSRAATLPGSCGKDSVKFDVAAKKSKSKLPSPAAGKAQIILLENENQMIGPFMHATVRFGMDGAWVGADNGNSYFVLEVTPGLHHLCASWQSAFHQFKKDVDLTSFTAEPGKNYYFSANVTVASKEEVLFDLSQLNDDKGQYRAELAKLAVSKAKTGQ